MKIKKGDIPHVQDGWKYETYINGLDVYKRQGVGYLGNGATNIIYPLTVIVLSIARCV